MVRKARRTYETENDIFAARLLLVMEEVGITRSALAKEISVKPQTVSLYTTGQSQPTADKISKIANVLNVSADYLLGLSDVKANNPSLASSCYYTGLTENVIDKLHHYANDDTEAARLFLEFVNVFLSDGAVKPDTRLVNGIAAQKLAYSSDVTPAFDSETGRVLLSAAETCDFYRQQAGNSAAELARLAVMMVFDNHDPQAAKNLLSPLYRKGK